MATKDTVMGRLLGSSGKFSDKQITETVDLLVSHGLERHASDIHIEPHDRFVLVRYRIDGSLRGMHKLPREALAGIIIDIKKRGGLAVQETHIPQDGQYELQAKSRPVVVHVSTMPVFGGEKAVLHLAVRPEQPESLETLGFWGEGLKALQAVLASPHGLVIVAGPHHSGVSSTIFSLLHQLNSPLLSLATVELHTKHRLPGVSQTYLSGTGMPVAEGLRAALKQDANVVMVGDVPDGQTAELAIHAAATGHLVIASLHAHSSLAGALRMRVAGVEPFLLVTALRASVGQRLVRTLCPDCRERYALDADAQRQLEKSFDITTTAAHQQVHALERAAAVAGLGNPKQLSSTPAHITHLWRAHPEGCSMCGHTGYRGRTAIVEVLHNTPGLQKQLMDRELSSVAELQTVAVRDGFVPMALDGLVKALCGQTTPTDVLHAVAL